MASISVDFPRSILTDENGDIVGKVNPKLLKTAEITYL